MVLRSWCVVDEEEQALVVLANDAFDKIRDEMVESLNLNCQSIHQCRILRGIQIGYVRAYVDLMQSVGSVVSQRITAATAPKVN